MSNGESYRPGSHESQRNPHENESVEAKKLPDELDNPGVIFAYGYLLDQSKLRALLHTRKPDFPIYETSNIEEARKFRAQPDAIVILRSVKMQGVDVTLVSEQQLRDWYTQLGHSEKALVEDGILTEKATHAGLYARPALPGGKVSRFLNGGLVCGFTQDELNRLDKFEMVPVYQRTPVSALTIGSDTYVPQHVTFYAGRHDLARNEGEVARMRGIINRKSGQLGPDAKWPRSVRSRKEGLSS